MSATFARLKAFRAIGLKLQRLSYLSQGRVGGRNSSGLRRDNLFTCFPSQYVFAPCTLCGHLNANDQPASAAIVRVLHTSASVSSKQRYKPKTFPSKCLKSKKADTIIEVWKNMTVTHLANALHKDLDHVFEAMIYVDNAAYYDTPDSVIHSEKVITEIVKKSGVRCMWIVNPFQEEIARASKDAVRRPPPEPSSSTLINRPPVVTIMGHVDHGKTTLLDSLRHTSVVSREFGGITQHIGAFLVRLPNEDTITFLDTPGHAAFMAMRARGARVTDIVVLVVAADDGVMKQTIECIRLANQANVPIIVAINKIDKPQADIETCKKELLQHGLQLEDTGGDIQAVPISALEGHNLDTLMETIVTQAELMQLKCDPDGLVEGYIVESRSDPFRGKLSTVIIQRGTLKKGACLVAGTTWAKVKAMCDETGKAMQAAPPSTPVEITGWKDLPSAGDEFLEVESEKRAHEVILHRLQTEREKKMAEDRTVVQMRAKEHLKGYQEALEKRRASGYVKTKRVGPREKEIKDDGLPRLAVVIKGDVDGSVEAILDVLVTYHSEKCPMDIVHFGVGMVCDNDIELCDAFNGIVYSFNVDTLPSAKNLAKSYEVPIKDFNVIYRLVDDIREEINRRLPLIDQEEIIGEANVQQQFVINDGPRKVPVAGCRCISGALKKSALFRLIRNQEVIHEGTMSSMRHLKDEVESIKKDVECGLKLTDDKVEFQPGDRLVCFKKTKVAQKTNWDPGF